MKTTVTIKTWVILDYNGRPITSFLCEDEARNYQYEKYSKELHNFTLIPVDLKAEVNLSLENLNINIKK